ncbi:MAG: NAD(P)/FAD-dependent oxidoreductase [Nanoarchaeota archaeon]|nr:NAD(P)/FAD-dependent oxidoreductase [Nanoarchaeota archaeon]
MIYSEVIIVGGGPAGSTCAWKLKKNKIDCIILDYAKFPRTKLCAGWITPEVFKTLELDDYPHGVVAFNLIKAYFFGVGKMIKSWQYSIRRYELDDWLLKRSGVKVFEHKVLSIRKNKGHYIIDDKYKCKYLVGAGGTYCPVYRTFFKDLNPKSKKSLVCCMEQEFKYDYGDKDCYLWFFENKLSGYAWYVPKGKGYLNVGIGGLFNRDVKKQWDYLVKKLRKLSLVKDFDFNPKGYLYYMRQNMTTGCLDNAFIIGDAAGLATQDLGEGIGPAVESGILAADSIIQGDTYSLESIKKTSYPSMLPKLFRFMRKLNRFRSFVQI